MAEGPRREFGFAIDLAERGLQHRSTKPLKGFPGGRVIEVIHNDQAGTYRAIYTVRFLDVVYVLHVFQKKSTQGIRTPKKEIELLHQRLRSAIQHHRENYE